ncbi:hypothetical protein [Dokdonia donghaensis]|uniref:Lipoprotein n=1 Tax=Dokdonia donghaensis DSW-1 TaxID=1300343 RepID=A0A0A2GWL5_9FLAO|nr:hypothetical protein [Dokdonia donghaensis]ANH60405.1 hypothetical protein I597_1494 [Dokdonia donghaensis DSW-1]KGO07674.1 hypothetical protein NV36_13065 [Dokdonia donghaensis DSW-1]
MNKIILIVLCLIVITACKSSFEPISIKENQLSQKSKDIAHNAALFYFNHCKSPQDQQLLKEWLDGPKVSNGLSRGLSAKKIECTCELINKDFGKLENLELGKIYGNGHSVVMYNYKATYSKLTEPAKISIYLDFRNIPNGVSIRKEYKDTYTPFTPGKECQDL